MTCKHLHIHKKDGDLSHIDMTAMHVCDKVVDNSHCLNYLVAVHMLLQLPDNHVLKL